MIFSQPSDELDEARQANEELRQRAAHLQEQVDDLELFNKSLLRDASEIATSSSASGPETAECCARLEALQKTHFQLVHQFDALSSQLAEERMRHRSELSDLKQTLAMTKIAFRASKHGAAASHSPKSGAARRGCFSFFRR